MIKRILDILYDRPHCYRVIYPEGFSTVRTNRSEARFLRKLYGGKVVYDPPEGKSDEFAQYDTKIRKEWR